jgi:hypothetical protein
VRKTAEGGKETASIAGSVIKEGIIKSLRGIQEVENEEVANESLKVTEQVVKSAVQAAEEVGSLATGGLVMARVLRGGPSCR